MNENEYKSQYRNKRVDKWLCGDIPSYRLVLQIQNDTGVKIK